MFCSASSWPSRNLRNAAATAFALLTASLPDGAVAVISSTRLETGVAEYAARKLPALCASPSLRTASPATARLCAMA